MLGRRLVRLPAQPAVDVAGGLLAVPDADRDRALVGHHVAAGEDPRVAGHHVRRRPDHAVLDLDARHAVEQRQVGVLAEREHHRVRLELLELAGGLGEARLVELHLLDHELALVGLLDRGEPAHQHALLLGLLDLEVVGGHALARAPVDDDRLLGAEPLGRARHVHRGVAAAVDDHAAPEHRLLLALHAAQHREGVEDVRGLAGGDVGALADVRADREEGRVEAARRACDSSTFVTLRFSSSVTPMSRMRCTSASSTSRGSRYFGMPKRIMPAGSSAPPRGSSPRGRAG